MWTPFLTQQKWIQSISKYPVFSPRNAAHKVTLPKLFVQIVPLPPLVNKVAFPFFAPTEFLCVIVSYVFVTSTVVGRRVVVLFHPGLASYVGQSEVPASTTTVFSVAFCTVNCSFGFVFIPPFPQPFLCACTRGNTIHHSREIIELA